MNRRVSVADRSPRFEGGKAIRRNGSRSDSFLGFPLCGRAKLPFAEAVRLDLNCDLVEGEPVRRTRALMGQVTSVNVACGGHAGDLASMERCLAWGRELGVRVGAHPGIAGAFGRGEVTLTSAGGGEGNRVRS